MQTQMANGVVRRFYSDFLNRFLNEKKEDILRKILKIRNGVIDGTRTRNSQYHKLELYH